MRNATRHQYAIVIVLSYKNGPISNPANTITKGTAGIESRKATLHIRSDTRCKREVRCFLPEELPLTVAVLAGGAVAIAPIPPRTGPLSLS